MALEALIEASWRAGVDAVLGERAVAAAAREQGLQGPLVVAAVGKAAASMLMGLLQAGVALERALVVTKDGHRDARLDGCDQVRQLEAAHPVPDARSLAAGEALQAFVDGCGAADQLLLLVSGGASALAELPAAGQTLQSVQRRTEALLAAGADIAAINAERRRLSRIKGGGLCANCRAPVRSWLLSDVRGDDPQVIGSGIGLLHDPARHRIVASNAIARDAAADALRRAGLELVCNAEDLYGDVEAVAERLAARLIDGPPGAYVWGGEPTVVLPERPGEGGRNQALAVALALRLDGRRVRGLVAGSDGSDGPTSAAGGWFGRAAPARAAAGAALAAADTGRYLRERGQLFSTGPTGTNVMDLVVAIKD